MSLEALFDQTVDIEREVVTVSTKGKRTTAWSTVLSQLPCAIQPLSSTELLEHLKAGRQTSDRMYCKTDITAGGGIVGAGTAETTVPDLIKGTQSDHNPRHRITQIKNGVTTRYGIEGQYDTLKKGIFSVLEIVEREQAWWND